MARYRLVYRERILSVRLEYLQVLAQHIVKERLDVALEDEYSAVRAFRSWQFPEKGNLEIKEPNFVLQRLDPRPDLVDEEVLEWLSAVILHFSF